MNELLPRPFCGGKARLLGGPMAQESYSVYCENRHHLDCGFNEAEAIARWNTRYVPEGYALVPIEHLAESGE